MRLWKILILIILLPLAYWFFFWPHYSWHQKMTIEVEKDGQVYTGSSVSSVFWNRNIISVVLGQGAAWLPEIKGEAVVVELPENKYLFALLNYSGNTEFTANLATRILFSSKQRVWGNDKFQAVLVAKTGAPLTVPLDNYPLLVTFTDIDDPASVEKVNPSNLEATFGPGVELKSLTLEITDEPVTRGRVEKVLGWIQQYYNIMFDGSRYESIKSNNRFANSLASGAFKTER